MTSRSHINKPGRRAAVLGLLMLLALYLAPLGLRASATTTNAQAQQAGTIKYIPDNPYGVNIFLHKEVEPWKIEKTLQMIATANIQWIKQEFPWNEIEFKKGYFYDDKWQKSSWQKFDQIVDLADKYHLRIIARIDHPPDWAKAPAGGTAPLNNNQDLADFANALLDHYKNRIIYIQLWNEPNLSAEWVPGKPVDPSGYADMLKTVYPAIKNAHPNAVVLTAPMAMTLEGPSLRGNMNELDYWTQLYAAGAKGNFDIASANGYGLDKPPDAPPSPDVLNFRRVELLHDIMVKNGDATTPVWFDEYGWNASPDTLSEEQKNYWRHVTPQQQADWTVQGIDYARKNWPWAGVISIWYFRQVGDIPPDQAEYYFQMVDPNFVPQPVYDSVKVDASNYPGPASQPLPTPANSEPTPTGGPAATDTPAAAADTPTATTTATPAVTPTESGPQATPTISPPPEVTAGNSTLIMYIIGGVLVVGGLAGLGYYFMRGRS